MLNARELVGALHAAQVDYIVIGGFAVAAHGFVRATKDLNIVPSGDAANLERLAAVLRELGAELFGTDDFDPKEFPFDPLDPSQLAEGGNFLLLTRFGRLDMMQWVPGIEADQAYERLRRAAVPTELDGRPVLVCSREDLITMKRTAGRPQDLVDLRELGEDISATRSRDCHQRGTSQTADRSPSLARPPVRKAVCFYSNQTQRSR